MVGLATGFLRTSYAHLLKQLRKKSPSENVKMVPRAAVTDQRKKKVIVIMGPTGCGKTKLSVDLASRFFKSSEIINSDKIQIYRGLDITTNKISRHERHNVPHHLIGEFDPSEKHPVFTPSDFRSTGDSAISDILSRRRLPFVVGGSNSFIYALLAKKYNPNFDIFNESSSSSSSSSYCRELRYQCCFLWIDVSPPVLNKYLKKRVNEMIASGMFQELREYITKWRRKEYGVNSAIGVPEFEKYLQRNRGFEDNAPEFKEAVDIIKDNTCKLAERQRQRILRLRDAAGWELKRVDATAAVKEKLEGMPETEVWETRVVEPSVSIVKRFLNK